MRKNQRVGTSHVIVPPLELPITELILRAKDSVKFLHRALKRQHLKSSSAATAAAHKAIAIRHSLETEVAN